MTRTAWIGVSIALVGCGSEPPNVAAPLPASPSAAPAPAASGPAPIAAALPTNGLATPLRKVTCGAKLTCDLGKSMASQGGPIRPVDDGSSPSAPLAAFGVELAKDGGRATAPFFDKLTMACVVIEGQLDVQAGESKETKVLGPWQGVVAPNGWVRVTAHAEGARVVFVVGTNDGSPLLDALPPDPSKPGPKAAPAAGPLTRAGAIRVFDLGKADDLAWGGGSFHARIGWEPDAAEKLPFLVDALRFGKDAGVAKHVHAGEWELVVMLDGAGSFVRTAPNEKDDSTSLGPGGIAVVAPNVPHAYQPAGTTPMTAIQVYSPRGPEQRFKKLAGK